MSANRECQAKARGQVNTQRETTGMFGEHKETLGNITEGYVCAREVYEKLAGTEGT